MLLRLIGLNNVPRPGATARVLRLLSGLMVVLALVATGILVLDLRQRELAHARGEISGLNRILAEQTTRTFEGVALVLKAAQERLSDDLGSSLSLESFPVQLLLRARASGLPQVKSIFVVNRDGLGVNSSRADFVRGLSMSRRSFYRHFAEGASDELFISVPERARVDGEWTFYVSTRLLDPDGQFRGVLVAAISIEYFESLYGSISFDTVSRIQLLNNEGLLLAGQPHGEAEFGRPGITPAALAELRNGTEAGITVSQSVAGETRYIAYRQVDKYPLMIGAAVDEPEALEPWRRVALPIVVGVTLFIVAVLLATFFMARNLLRREALESDLKERDEQLRRMVQSVHDAIVTIDAGGRLVLFNRAAEKMFGLSVETAIGCSVTEWLARSARRPHGKELQRYLHEAVQAPAGMVLLGLLELVGDEQEFPVELSLSTTLVRGQVLVTAIFRDLAERRRAERELVATNRQLQDLSASLQNIREEERARIARELHDELGQLLTGMRMEVSWLGGRLAPEQATLAGKIASIKGMIDQTIVSVRRISSELRPLVLDDLGFAAAAAWYVDQFSARTGLPVTLELPADDPRQDDAVATALFRILQESLTNIARHAQAGKVEVRLLLRGNDWVLSISDNGRGFTQNASRSGGIGLIGMRERAHILGGSFCVNSTPGQGTVIEAVIPQKSNTR
ncbi:MAG: PAS domain S-box protein [Bacteroidota bacterium]